MDSVSCCCRAATAWSARALAAVQYPVTVVGGAPATGGEPAPAGGGAAGGGPAGGGPEGGGAAGGGAAGGGAAGGGAAGGGAGGAGGWGMAAPSLGDDGVDAGCDAGGERGRPEGCRG